MTKFLERVRKNNKVINNERLYHAEIRYIIMQLSNILTQQQPEVKSQTFFTCFIEDSFVTLAMWTIVNDRPKVITIGTPKEWAEEANFFDAVELGLEEFHKPDTPKQVLFSLPETWLTDNQISPERKTTLKTLSQKLDIKPLGFVVSVEALFHYIFEYKTSSILALFFQFDAHEIKIFVTEHGNIIEREVVGRSENLVDDMREAFSRIPTRPLPASAYFFSFDLTLDQLEAEKQTFLEHEWDKEDLFRHLPSIELLTRATMVEAACLIGGKEVMQSDTDESSPAAAGVAAATATSVDANVTEVKAEENATSPEDQSEPQQAEEANMSSFGIKMPPKVISAPGSASVQTADNSANSSHDPLDYAIEVDQPQTDGAKLKKWSPKFKFSPKSLIPFKSFPKIKGMPGGNRNKRTAVVLAIGILFLIFAGGTYAYLATQSRVDVEIFLATKNVSTDALITLDPDVESTQAEDAILKVETISTEVTDKEQSSTTGTKVIGEKAKGKIVFLNKTTNSKSFPAGTEVKDGDKVFLTDSEVTVASASSKESGDTQTIEFGKASVAITAAEIGAEFNIDKDVELSVANFGKDTYAARTEEALKGGTSREIQAVSQQDRTKLAASLKEKLVEQAENKLQTEASEGVYIISTGESQISSQEFSAEVGEETNTLELTMTLKLSAYSYQASDLTPIGREKLLSLVPDGGVLLDDSISILSRQSEEASEEAQLQLEAVLSADYVPPTDSDSWLNEIKSKTIEQTKRVLTEKEEIESVELKFYPSLAQTILGRLPGNPSRIAINKKTK